MASGKTYIQPLVMWVSPGMKVEISPHTDDNSLCIDILDEDGLQILSIFSWASNKQALTPLRDALNEILDGVPLPEEAALAEAYTLPECSICGSTEHTYNHCPEVPF